MVFLAEIMVAHSKHACLSWKDTFSALTYYLVKPKGPPTALRKSLKTAAMQPVTLCPSPCTRPKGRAKATRLLFKDVETMINYVYIILNMIICIYIC